VLFFIVGILCFNLQKNKTHTQHKLTKYEKAQQQNPNSNAIGKYDGFEL